MPSTKMTEKHVHTFYETLSFLLTEKYGVEITIEVTKKEEVKEGKGATQ